MAAVRLAGTGGTEQNDVLLRLQVVSAGELEAAVLPTNLVSPPLVVSLEEWRQYERGEADRGRKSLRALPTTMEREQPRRAVDPAEIGAALQRVAVKRPERDVIDFHLGNNALAVSLRLSVDRERKDASLYLRGSTAFLGFVHVSNIAQTVD
jgi:hypothetical protein